MLTRLTTIAFVVMLLVIIALANHGALTVPWAWLHAVPAGDKVGHFVLMGLLAFLVHRCVTGGGTLTSRATGRRVLLIILALVTVEEMTQILLPYRSFSWGDLLSDYLGILGFWWLAAWLATRRRACDTVPDPV